MRIAPTVCAGVLLVGSTGCGVIADDSRSYGCTPAGKNDTSDLQAAIGKVSVIANGFPNTLARFSECDEGGSTGVSVDPFPRGVTLEEAEAGFRDEFDCGTPGRSQDFGYPTSKFECTISGVRADVALEFTDGRSRAFVIPRR